MHSAKVTSDRNKIWKKTGVEASLNVLSKLYRMRDAGKAQGEKKGLLKQHYAAVQQRHFCGSRIPRREFGNAMGGERLTLLTRKCYRKQIGALTDQINR